ncbi:MAG: bifunctional folylpolyglutamate synthase/dihydrofolate synthase [Sulfuricurvum sp.]|jgi:dihydrofolate synthase/folylpolyglutamate synthase|uniref:bifunctional folylpolyglutamate synthase/dihydrofolate synthase n=1 Tax=Sulfuricurvum sp. TaxID=2025608 RepID=UPI0025E5412B|nr:bifunctional folylpolyglutamate synthase/dihydrofolate synthase [Sulfuricurvum sp.]MCI4405768.1 bifunctional folylpolyglutamate synthase/dihydrofolate synthase [Sulfuricurvum sp.]
MNLDDFLAAKPLFYDVIDYERFPKTYRTIAASLPNPKILHLVGTNAKGSTGRFLATALYRAGKKVGHYTSPHILRFNERIWIDGTDVRDEALEIAHQKLLALLSHEDAEALSYFEYTTLLAMVVYEGCEYVVMEAGLGGEFDATAVFPKVLSIFTPIDFDHAAFLGTTIDAIATTKLRSMQHEALLGTQKHSEVERIAKEIAHTKGCRLYTVEECLNPRLTGMALHLATKNGLSEYLRDNLLLAMAAYELLGYEVREELFDQRALFGRLSPIAPNITLDVGHNPLAAREIARSYKGKKVVLIYNTYRDKDYREILGILKPIIESVEIIDVDEARITPRDQLENALNELQIEFRSFEAIDQDKEYLVFGSFSVAETFLKRMNVTSTMV